MYRPVVKDGRAFVMEFKATDNYKEMESKCDEAYNQASKKHYLSELEQMGYKDIAFYGICFCKKDCMVKKNSTDDNNV